MIGFVGEGSPSRAMGARVQEGLVLSLGRAGALSKSGAAAASDGADGFAATLRAALNAVNRAQHEASVTAHQFAAGMPVELHDVMIAAERAALTLELTAAIQNKVVEAYREVTRMQV